MSVFVSIEQVCLLQIYKEIHFYANSVNGTILVIWRTWVFNPWKVIVLIGIPLYIKGMVSVNRASLTLSSCLLVQHCLHGYSTFSRQVLSLLVSKSCPGNMSEYIHNALGRITLANENWNNIMQTVFSKDFLQLSWSYPVIFTI